MTVIDSPVKANHGGKAIEIPLQVEYGFEPSMVYSLMNEPEGMTIKKQYYSLDSYGSWCIYLYRKCVLSLCG